MCSSDLTQVELKRIQKVQNLKLELDEGSSLFDVAIFAKHVGIGTFHEESKQEIAIQILCQKEELLLGRTLLYDCSLSCR